MSFVKAYANFFRNYFPNPLSIALILTGLSFTLALIFTAGSTPLHSYLPDLGKYWFEGMFKPNLLAFTVQMMLILVLGHILALTALAQRLIDFSLQFCRNTPTAVWFTCFFTILISLFNWGLGLIFGAIFARKIGEHFQKRQQPLNYALVGASAYVGLMVWHGGLSGSAPLTVAGTSHSLSDKIGSILLSETVFSGMNIFATVLLLLGVPLAMYLLAKTSDNNAFYLPSIPENKPRKTEKTKTPAEKLELSPLFNRTIGGLMLLFFLYLNIEKYRNGGNIYGLLNLKTTNLLLLSLAFFLHKNMKSLLNAIEVAIRDVSGILIQFPLYFGIMGIMQGSGLASLIAQAMTAHTTAFSLPVYTFVSAGVVNMFVPSGGGQWQIQGPIIAETAQNLQVSLPKMIMALSYGDQLTNMLQPFWALPLLGITGLKAKDILPYTLVLFMLGLLIFLSALLLF